MRNSLRSVALALAVCCLVAFAGAEEKEQVNERKIQYARSEADVFMSTLDEVMKMELVREVLSENDEILMAKMLYGEDRENPMYMRAAVIWCVYNRMDASNKSIGEIINRTSFPGYLPGNPVMPWAIDLIRDVTIRYVLELNGFKDVGRVLPREYLYYEQLEGHRDHVFKTTLRLSDPKCKRWKWTLPSPYHDN